MEEKQYLILGDNNFWYSTFHATNVEEMKIEIDEVKEKIRKREFDHDAEPENIYIYEVIKVYGTTV